MERLCFFWGSFLGGLEQRSEKDSKSSRNRSLVGGGRHGSSVVNSVPNGLLRVFERAPFLCQFWINFRLHFGATLGTKFATILLFGRPGRQNGPSKAV